VSFLNTDIEAYVYDQDTFDSLARRLCVILGADFEDLEGY